MGITGSGKTSFVKTVTGRNDNQVSNDLFSDTSEIKAYPFSYKSVSYVLVDTPGFNDTIMSNKEVTAKIIQWLESSYSTGARVNGIVCIHDITKPGLGQRTRIYVSSASSFKGTLF
ncbi:hypothetical protein DL98DRAFT_639842 [Cadophora sp. DSE1049]|nr:hypothetical protein DL98DRAFT_639842 [Cadophora sp. DSE1049]